MHVLNICCYFQIQGDLPPGADFGAQLPAQHPVLDSLCVTRSPMSAVNRSLTWLPPPNYGGNVTSICFAATDSCGGCGCSGGENTTVQCVIFQVIKCRYSVGIEHQVYNYNGVVSKMGFISVLYLLIGSYLKLHFFSTLIGYR